MNLQLRQQLLAAELNVPIAEISKHNYSIKRALLDMATGSLKAAGFEREVSEALSRIHGTPRGVWVPDSEMRAALSTATGSSLLFDKPVEQAADPLRALSVLGSLGATFELVSAMKAAAIVKQPADGSVAWLSEGATGSETNATTARVTIPRKTVRARNSTTKQLEIESHGMAKADAIELRSLAGAIAAEIDRVGVNGSGGANEPAGILNTPGIGSVALGANGAAPTYTAICQLEETVGLANADVRCGFATTPQARRKLRTTEKAAGSGLIWGDSGLLGKPSIASTNVPSTLTKGSGSNLSAIIYGDFQHLMVVRFGPLDIQTDPYTRGDEGEIVYRVFAGIGIGLRYVEAFAAITDAVTT